MKTLYPMRYPVSRWKPYILGCPASWYTLFKGKFCILAVSMWNPCILGYLVSSQNPVSWDSLYPWDTLCLHENPVSWDTLYLYKNLVPWDTLYLCIWKPCILGYPVSIWNSCILGYLVFGYCLTKQRCFLCQSSILQQNLIHYTHHTRGLWGEQEEKVGTEVKRDGETKGGARIKRQDNKAKTSNEKGNKK